MDVIALLAISGHYLGEVGFSCKLNSIIKSSRSIVVEITPNSKL